MNRVESFITAHIGDSINECDDNFAVDFAHCRFAVADGSSSDFFSNIYARLLSDTFVAEGCEMFTVEKITEINTKWLELVQQKLDEADCKPGSFPYVRFQKRDPGCSTLVGLHLYEKDSKLWFSCSGLGDSVLFFIANGEKEPSFQFSSYSNESFTLDQSIEFGYVPIISRSTSTNWIENIIKVHRELQQGVLYLMTDGLAEWILRNDNGELGEKFETLANIHSQSQFLSYIDDIRAKGAHNDDMTLMKVYIDDLSLSFNESLDNIYDYRAEAQRLEQEELERHKAEILQKEKMDQQRRAELQQKNKEYDDIIARAQAKVKAENERKKLEQDLEKALNNTKKLEVNLKKSNDENRRLEDRLKKSNDENKRLEERLKKSNDENRRLEERLKKSNDENRRLEERLKKFNDENRRLEERLKKSNDENKRLEERLKKSNDEERRPEDNFKNDKDYNERETDDTVASSRKSQDSCERYGVYNKEHENSSQENDSFEEDTEVSEQKKKLKNNLLSIIRQNSNLLLALFLLISIMINISKCTSSSTKEEELISKIDSISKVQKEDSARVEQLHNELHNYKIKYLKALEEN